MKGAMMLDIISPLKILIRRVRAEKTLDSVMDTIDLERFRVFQERYRDSDPAPGSSKYLDIRFWMGDHLHYVYRLNLHRSAPLNILDLGAGCGYFPYLCQHFGHSTMTIDLDTVPLYNDITAFLGLSRKIWEIRAFQKLPDLGRRFDLITALGVCFNGHNKADVWDVDEWEYLLEDLAQRQLTEGGRVFLKLNAERTDTRFYTDSLLNYLRDRGALVEGRHVYFRSMTSFRSNPQ